MNVVSANDTQNPHVVLPYSVGHALSGTDERYNALVQVSQFVHFFGSEMSLTSRCCS